MSSALARPTANSPAGLRLSAGRAAIESHLAALLDSGQPATPIRRALQYVVLGQGQRFRPILALRIARLRGRENFPAPVAMAAATGVVAVESFSRNRSYARPAAVPQVLRPFRSSARSLRTLRRPAQFHSPRSLLRQEQEHRRSGHRPAKLAPAHRPRRPAPEIVDLR